MRVNSIRYVPQHISLPSGWGIILAEAHLIYGTREVIYRHDDRSLVYLTINRAKQVQICLATISLQVAEAIGEELKAKLPERPKLSEKEEVSVDFWSLTPIGARAIQRTISITPWDRLKQNYSAATKGGLSHLMEGFRPTKAGQLLLWYGPPGTGKTWALRALAWEWRKWCSCHYITDPETFFGSSAGYMLDVLLLRNDDDEPEIMSSDNRTIDGVEPVEKQWRLLILEDSGELMTPDAKSQTGQGLSRLLNVVDGLIGQGLRIMVLVTTNEVLKKLHPAVARPGRCAARIEFGEFKKEEGQLWLANQKAPMTDLPVMISLAELYAKIGDTQTISESRKLEVGFAS